MKFFVSILITLMMISANVSTSQAEESDQMNILGNGITARESSINQYAWLLLMSGLILGIRSASKLDR